MLLLLLLWLLDSRSDHTAEAEYERSISTEYSFNQFLFTNKQLFSNVGDTSFNIRSNIIPLSSTDHWLSSVGNKATIDHTAYKTSS